MTTAVIIQARLGSKRFPGKVLALLAGKPVLQHVIERCQSIPADLIVVAYPEKDTEIENIAMECGADLAQVDGPEDDVLGRYFAAANRYDVDLIMRITADCPLIDANKCRNVLALTDRNACSYAAIGWPKGGFPKGYGCEVFSKLTLQLANELAVDPYDREHVTPWMERNVRCKYLENDKDESHLNFCVDYPEDIARLEQVIDARRQIT